MCRHGTNPTGIPRCEICNFKAPKVKTACRIGGRLFLLALRSVKPPEKRETLQAFDVDSQELHTGIPLVQTDEPLEQRMVESVRGVLGSAQPDLQATVQQQIDSGGSPVTYWQQEAEDGGGSRATSSLKESSVTSGPESNNEAAVQGNLEVERRERGKPANPHDLFSMVLQDATGLVYDSHIGQYVEKKSLGSHDGSPLRADADDSDDEASVASFHGLREDFNFVKSMRRERDVMRETVEDRRNRQARRGDLGGGGFGNGATAVGRGTAFSLPGTLAFSSSTDSRQQQPATEVPCALCEREFRPENLPGRVPFHAVASWREKHFAPFSKADQRLDVFRRYEACSLCVFCTQFFDRNFTDYLAYHKGTTTLEDPVLDLEQESDSDGLAARQAAHQRPLSPVRQGLAMLHLRSMRDKPLLMENVGCQLAKWSNRPTSLSTLSTPASAPKMGKYGKRRVHRLSRSGEESMLSSRHSSTGYATTSPGLSRKQKSKRRSGGKPNGGDLEGAHQLQSLKKGAGTRGHATRREARTLGELRL